MKCFEITCTLPDRKNPVFHSACINLILVKVLNTCRQNAPLSVTDYGKWNIKSIAIVEFIQAHLNIYLKFPIYSTIIKGCVSSCWEKSDIDIEYSTVSRIRLLLSKHRIVDYSGSPLLYCNVFSPVNESWGNLTALHSQMSSLIVSVSVQADSVLEKAWLWRVILQVWWD